MENVLTKMHGKSSQSPNGNFTFASGEVPLNGGYLEALGGLSTNYKVREEHAVNMVGQVVVNHFGDKKLVFSAQSDARVSPNGNGGGTMGFEADVRNAKVTGQKVYIMDGGSSVAMAFADPNANSTDTLTVQYGGVKHGSVFGYYVNTYLMFKCTRPRIP